MWARQCEISAILLAALGTALLGARAGDENPPGNLGARLFHEKIEPVLVAECHGCHSAGAKQVRGSLKLDTRAAMLQGGDTGPAVVPGKADESLILQAIRHENGLEMPPKKSRLPAPVIADFERWIKLGAPAPASSGPDPVASPIDLGEARRHWSFQPIRKPAIPHTRSAPSPRNPVDAFVLARLEERGWSLAPPASRTEWIRRVTFDLTGLPPTPEEIDAYEHDNSSDADERLVDRLMASPRYGERWAQHWLDVVRYAETEGYEYDRAVPDSWRFRDYVIASLNEDKPFDRFLTEQLAGDEIAPGDTERQVASIFHRLGPVRRNAGNPEIALSRNEVLTERTDIVGAAFLGLTIGCARCHNHKLEPISQKDYYRLQAYMAATEEHNINLAPVAEFRTWEVKTKEIQNEIKRLKRRMRRASDEEQKRLADELQALDDSMPPRPATIPATTNDPAARTEIHVLHRGVWEDKGERVSPRPPSVLVSSTEPELPADVPDPRTRLARWLTSPEHPLTARVLVNRTWAQHFGAGLVRTLNDFGTHGDRPSHPELLDWLAASLVENGWRLKPLHRMIVLSAAYRQSSQAPLAEQAQRIDPENRLLWRMNRRRLTAEEIRDAMLAVAGRLCVKAGGPSVLVPVDDDLVKLLYKPSQWQVTPAPTEHDRRTIYLIAKRNLRLPFMDTFDAPALQSSCTRRESSTHAPQALELLNGRLSNDLARSFASRLRAECGGADCSLADRAFRLALGRPPVDEELAASLAFLRDEPIEDFTLALFNLNGFLYVW
jgi:hypothetical protein